MDDSALPPATGTRTVRAADEVGADADAGHAVPSGNTTTLSTLAPPTGPEAGYTLHKHTRPHDVGTHTTQPPDAALLLVPTLLIARQPDLGTAVLVFAAGAYVIFFAGFPWKLLIALAVGITAATPLLWMAMHDYQRQRVLTLIDPSSDPLGKGFHIIQSTIAVGSGGLWGKGWLQGTQARLEFIPESTTDFVFAVFAEEFGLVGNLILLVLYLALMLRGLMIAASGATMFMRLLAGSITMIFFTYAFVNMGMVSGILPVVGVPLPWMSYGGTAMVTLGLGAGLLMSIHRHRKLVQT
jgi:rod shape determining protein RodA